MAGEWQRRRLPEIADFQEGPGIMAADFRGAGVPLLRLRNIRGPFVDLDGCNFLDLKKVSRKWSHFRLTTGDLLISTSASLGRVSEVTEAASGSIAYTGIIRFRVRDPVVTREYLRVWLSSREFIDQAEAVAAGSVIRHFGPSHLRDMWISVPSLRDQALIGEIGQALDSKIELNRRIAERLEAMARALFKSWFIDFEPVKAKAEGRSTGLPDDLVGFFPDRFGDNGLPEGWTTMTFGDLFDISGGNTPRTADPAFWGGPHQWATPKDLSGLAAPVLLQTARSLTDAGLAQTSSGLLPPRSLLLSTRAPIGYMAFITEPTAINQGFAGIIQKAASTTYAWAWCHANMDVITGNAGGSTFPEISKAVLRQLPMLAPRRGVLAAFGSIADTLFDRLIATLTENQTLAELRDTLLPKLVSGELPIADAEKRIVAA